MCKITYSLIILLLSISTPAFAGLPDTGQTKCYNNSVEITCPQPGEAFYGQDAQYGPNLQSFTKLDDNGTALPDNATTWAMVRDNVTGLEWQQATAPGTYTWQQAIDYCESLNLGGHNDWRLPTIKELSTLVDSSHGGHYTFNHWSSTTSAEDPNEAWYVDLYWGIIWNECCAQYVRAVRGGQLSNLFVDNGDGTVTDNDTGLMWQQATAPDTYTWEQALAYCENLILAGYTDWRLPNRNELQSLVDYSKYNPAIHTAVFPGTQAHPYWSSTTFVPGPIFGWFVDFYSGVVYAPWNNGDKSSSTLYVRAVRGGPSGPFGDSDNDWICDDGDNSSIVGDNPCTGGQTQDCDDNCINNANPLQEDSDNDTIGDACDICWTKSNPTQLDTNGNCPAPPYISDPKCGDACNVCMADFKNDGKVLLSDLVLLKTDFGRTNCRTVTPYCQADANGDGKVILSDLVILKTEFGRTNCFQ